MLRNFSFLASYESRHNLNEKAQLDHHAEELMKSMLEKGLLSNEAIGTVEDIPKEKRSELMAQIKKMLLRSNMSLQESNESEAGLSV